VLLTVITLPTIPFTYLEDSLPRSQNPDTSHASSHINTVHHTPAQSSLTIRCNFNAVSLQNSLSTSFTGIWYLFHPYACFTSTLSHASWVIHPNSWWVV